MEEQNFNSELQAALNAKMAWFNTERLQELIVQYRLLQTCVGNIFDTFTKKSIIVPDPYRLDKRISEITVPDSAVFSDAEMPKVFGARFSDYNTMLDYICTYFRFSVENITIPQVKKLIEFNKFIEWDNVTSNNPKINTRSIAMCMAQAKNGSPAVIQSMLNDSVAKCASATKEINLILNELGIFQREVYKGELRSNLCEHPEFNKETAYSSPDAELAEFKRLYTRVMGKRVFYNDLVSEIIEEDQGANKEKKREAVLARLQISVSQKVTEKKQKGPNSKELIMATVMAIAGFAPTLIALHGKLSENFTVFYTKKKTLLNRLIALIKKALNLREKDHICNVTIKDPKTGGEKVQKVNVSEFLIDLAKKERVYTGIGTKGPEYSKIDSSPEDMILSFVNKQISEVQSAFTIINALDNMFKTETDIMNRAKIKGMQIELSALRNSIINANKKRGEYASVREEIDQMSKLGINHDE